MLDNFRERKEFYLNELLQGVDINNDNISSDNPTFLDRLYSTNSFYRHMNPQQPLENHEKEPIVKHDHLAVSNISENE